MKKRIGIYVLIVLGILLVSFGVTYAWFTAIAPGKALTATSGKLSVNYTKGQTVSGKLYPTENYLAGLNTTVYIGLNSDSLAAIGTITLDLVSLPQPLQTAALKWELRDPVTSNIITTGNFEGKKSGESLVLVNNINLTTVQKGYALYIWLDGSLAGNEVQNQNFSANLVASAVQTNYTP